VTGVISAIRPCSDFRKQPRSICLCNGQKSRCQKNRPDPASPPYKCPSPLKRFKYIERSNADSITSATISRKGEEPTRSGRVNHPSKTIPADNPMGVSSGLVSVVIFVICQPSALDSAKKLMPTPDIDGLATAGNRQSPSPVNTLHVSYS